MDPYHCPTTMYDPRGFPTIHHPQPPYLHHHHPVAAVAGALSDVSRVRGAVGGGGGVRRRPPGAKLSTDPQSVAARERRHRISDRFRVLRSLVPGGSKMDTVSMLEQAIHYVKFLKAQISLHQAALMQHEEGCHAELAAAYAAAAVAVDNEVTLASHGRGAGACDEQVMQQQLQVVPAEGSALTYGGVAAATHQLYGLDPRHQLLGGQHQLPPLPASCVFVEEPADACYSAVCDLDDGETGLPGSY